MYEPNAFVVPGFPPAMPRSTQPPIGLTDQEILCVIAHLQTLGGTPTVTLKTTHRYYTHRRAGAPRGRRRSTRRPQPPPNRARRRKAPPALPPPQGRGPAMNILVVLAVVAVFGLLRFRRANLLVWAGAWWVGIYVLLRFGFTAPIPASVVSIYMGIVSLAILAYCPPARSAVKKSRARSSGS